MRSATMTSVASACALVVSAASASAEDLLTGLSCEKPEQIEAVLHEMPAAGFTPKQLLEGLSKIHAVSGKVVCNLQIIPEVMIKPLTTYKTITVEGKSYSIDTVEMVGVQIPGAPTPLQLRWPLPMVRYGFHPLVPPAQAKGSNI